jgi:BlaI family transcriptional regulator, penicillinase repressor
MGRTAAEQPTELELLILKVLWERSPLPVSEIRDALASEGRDLAHTTVITTLGTMIRKRQVKRTKHGKAYWFAPVVDESKVSHRAIADLLNRLFDGSVHALLLSLFDSKSIGKEELQELRKLLDEKTKANRGRDS